MIMGSLVSRGKSVLAGLVLGLLVFAVPVDGQTPDQVKAFQSMPKDQRNSLLQQMGLGGTAAGRGFGGGRGRGAAAGGGSAWFRGRAAAAASTGPLRERRHAVQAASR